MNRKERRAYESQAHKALMRSVDAMCRGKNSHPDEVPASPCGHCGRVMDGASSATGATAKPGDITVCIRCGGANTFLDDLTLSKLTEEQVEAHPASEDIRASQDMIRSIMGKAAMGGGPKTTPEA